MKVLDISWYFWILHSIGSTAESLISDERLFSGSAWHDSYGSDWLSSQRTCPPVPWNRRSRRTGTPSTSAQRCPQFSFCTSERCEHCERSATHSPCPTAVILGTKAPFRKRPKQLPGSSYSSELPQVLLHRHTILVPAKWKQLLASSLPSLLHHRRDMSTRHLGGNKSQSPTSQRFPLWLLGHWHSSPNRPAHSPAPSDSARPAHACPGHGRAAPCAVQCRRSQWSRRSCRALRSSRTSPRCDSPGSPEVWWSACWNASWPPRHTLLGTGWRHPWCWSPAPPWPLGPKTLAPAAGCRRRRTNSGSTAAPSAGATSDQWPREFRQRLGTAPAQSPHSNGKSWNPPGSCPKCTGTNQSLLQSPIATILFRRELWDLQWRPGPSCHLLEPKRTMFWKPLEILVASECQLSPPTSQTLIQRFPASVCGATIITKDLTWFGRPMTCQ